MRDDALFKHLHHPLSGECTEKLKEKLPGLVYKHGLQVSLSPKKGLTETPSDTSQYESLTEEMLAL